MGLDLHLIMADWERLRDFPVEDRRSALDEAVWPPDVDDEYYGGPLAGWVWPPGDGPAWCAEYHFACTTGAYWPHARACAAWDDMRGHADASLREVMDGFLNGLIRHDDPDSDPALTGAGGFFPPVTDLGRSPALLLCPPETAPAKVHAWQQVAPRLEELRGPFAAECAGWAGRPDTFEEFTTLLCEWGDVLVETARRGWGLVGLP